MFTAEEFRGSIMFNCGVVMGKQSFKGSLKKRAQGLGNFFMKVMAAWGCGSCAGGGIVSTTLFPFGEAAAT